MSFDLDHFIASLATQANLDAYKSDPKDYLATNYGLQISDELSTEIKEALAEGASRSPQIILYPEEV